MIWEVDERERVIEGVDAEGRPDPAYAAALGLIRAPYGRRALAVVVDIAIWIVIQLPLWLGAMPLVMKLADGAISPYGLVNHAGFVPAVVCAAITVVLSLVFTLVQWILHGRRGFTIGKVAAGIRTVNVRTLERPGVWRMLLRFLIVSVSGIVPLFGPAVVLLSVTFDPQSRGRGWHDRAAQAWLVDARKGLDPYDEKRMRVARKGVSVGTVRERAKLPSLATSRDPGAQPEYQPGRRISAGVLGAGRAAEPAHTPAAPRSLATPPADASAPAAAPVAAPAPVAPPVAAPPVAPPAAAPPVAAPAPVASAPVAAAPESAGPAAAPPVASVHQPPAAVAPAPVTPPAPAAPASAAPAPQPRSTGLGLRLDTGELIPVSEPVLLGRDPDLSGHTGARPIRIADATRSLSKTHALVRPAPGGIELVDCQSTNGCALIRGGVEHELPGGGAALVALGDTIRLGDRTADVVSLDDRPLGES